MAVTAEARCPLMPKRAFSRRAALIARQELLAWMAAIRDCVAAESCCTSR
jgi:hypothetical protein